MYTHYPQVGHNSIPILLIKFRFLARYLDAVLSLGVDDGEKIWVNGELAFDNFVARPLQADQDKVPVKLKAGTNRILMKIYQNNLGWEFCLRLTKPDGTVIPLP